MVKLALNLITGFLVLSAITWFAITIAIHSISDESLGIPGPQGALLQSLAGPLTTLSRAHYVMFGIQLVMSFLACAACWLAAVHQTRQLRAAALVGSIWSLFSWFVYFELMLQAFDDDFPLCTGPIFAADNRFCMLSRAAGVMSCCMALGLLGLVTWAAIELARTRLLEPYCELTREELIYSNALSGNLSTAAQGIAAKGVSGSVPIESVPLGLIPEIAPTATGTTMAHHFTEVDRARSNKWRTTLPGSLSALNQQRIDLPGRIELLFIGLTISGFIICMIPMIELFRFDHQITDLLGPQLLGDPVIQANMVFIQLHLFFALTIGTIAAYDRLRNNAVSPLFLNFISSIMLLGITIYSLRRIEQQTAPVSNLRYFDAQTAQAAGLAIMCISEVLRLIPSLMMCTLRVAALHPHKNAADVTANSAQYQSQTINQGQSMNIGSNELTNNNRFSSVGTWLYRVLMGLMLLTVLAWLAVMIGLQSLPGLFNNIGGTTGSGDSLGMAGDLFQWHYHNYAVSLLILTTFFASNLYIELANTRTAGLSAFAIQLFQCGTWLLLCFPIAYSFAFDNGYGSQAFGAPNVNNDTGKILTDLSWASSRIEIALFCLFVLNTFTTLARMIGTYIGHRASYAHNANNAVARTDTVVQRGTIGFNDRWISGEILFWLSIAGWLTYAGGAIRENTYSYFLGEPAVLNTELPFNAFQLIAIHFIAIGTIISLFVRSHIISNKIARDHSDGWRLGMLASYTLSLMLSIPLVVLMARYIDFYGSTNYQRAMIAGLAIVIFSETVGFIQQIVYNAMYPVSAIIATNAGTLNIPAQLQYNKYDTGLATDLEKGGAIGAGYQKPAQAVVGADVGINDNDLNYQYNKQAKPAVAGAGTGLGSDKEFATTGLGEPRQINYPRTAGQV